MKPAQASQPREMSQSHNLRGEMQRLRETQQRTQQYLDQQERFLGVVAARGDDHGYSP